MKNMFRFSALLCAMAIFVTSCTKDETAEPFNPTPVTGEIQFGARAGFEHAGESRTIYSGEPYTVDGKTFQKIDWVNGEDVVQIYCAEAAGELKTMDYKVVQGQSTTGGTTTTFSYLEKTTPSALAWGSGTHTFYAMYPATSMIPAASTLAQGIKMDGTKLNGIVPDAQAPKTITNNDGNYVCTPDMTYAYMAAKATAEPTEGGVSLDFVPIVTAVEIQLTLPSKVTSGTGAVNPISIAEIQVEGTGIAGAFQADLASWTETYPTCVDVEGKAASNVIQFSTWLDNKPITLQPGKSLTFTVFMRPKADITNLKVRISPSGAAYLGKELTGVTITKHVKTIIKNIYLPAAGVKIDASKWMSQLEPATQMKKLSLPGTGGSFSYNYNSSNPGWYKQQTLTFDQQWAAGIRAFEIVSDRPVSASDDYTSWLCGDMTNQQVQCNGVDMGVTVYEVLSNLLKKVTENSSECAVLILTYQPTGGLTNLTKRHANRYAASLRKMYENSLSADQKQHIIQYTPDLTLEQAAGNVMIFCRINQKNESEDGTFSGASSKLEGTNITLIDGCGTGKDRWGARGYKIGSTVAYDAANTSNTNSVDYWMQSGSDFAANVTTPNYSPGNNPMNFGWATNYTNITCWYQEWARVVDLDHLGVTSGNYYSTSSNVRWYESYSEKLNAAETTFQMAISDKFPSYVFINSLCGYLVDKDIESSYTIFTGSNTGGMAGNIKALADKINPAFYQYVLSAGMEQTTGPTGIVMMDYVTNTPTEGVEYDGSYLLPGVIIANNFKFTTTGGGTSGGQTGGGAGEGEGGSVGGDGDDPSGEDGI